MYRKACKDEVETLDFYSLICSITRIYIQMNKGISYVGLHKKMSNSFSSIYNYKIDTKMCEKLFECLIIAEIVYVVEEKNDIACSDSIEERTFYFRFLDQGLLCYFLKKIGINSIDRSPANKCQ